MAHAVASAARRTQRLLLVITLLLALVAPAVRAGAAAYPVSGTVTDSVSSAPIAGVEVWLYSADLEFMDDTVTDASGYYYFTAMDGNGDYVVDFYKPGYVYDFVEFTYSGSAISRNVSLVPLAKMATGTVTDAVTGAPIEEAFIWSAILEDSEYYEDGFALTDGTGHYDLFDDWEYGPGTYKIYVEAEGYAMVSTTVTWNGSSVLTKNFALQQGADQVKAVQIEGANRYETAVKGSKLAFPDAGECEHIVIASGVNFPDALGGSALAGALGCPVLLTDPAAISATVLAEVDRLGAKNAWIVGGTSAVSENVLASLRKAGVDCVRIAGKDRYQTAAMVAEKTVALMGPAFFGEVMFATGENFPDALAAAPLATWAGTPILLVTRDGVPASTMAAIERIKPDSGVILGGDGVIGTVPTATLRTHFGSSLKRLAGNDRYSTAVEIAEYGVDEYGLWWDGTAFATGENFPDALAGGAIQGLTGSVMLLTQGETLSPAASGAISTYGSAMREVRFFGGKNAISDAVRNQVLLKVNAAQ
jgi:putative cell wall-binding protein